MKVCSKCDTEKSERDFYVRTDGCLFAECKECNNERGRKYKKKNWLKVNDKHKEWLKQNPEKVKKYEADKRKRGKKRIRKYLKEYEKNDRALLHPRYLKRELRWQGFTDEQIEQMPILLEKKKLDILLHRSNKIIKQHKNKNNGKKSDFKNSK